MSVVYIAGCQQHIVKTGYIYGNLGILNMAGRILRLQLWLNRGTIHASYLLFCNILRRLISGASSDIYDHNPMTFFAFIEPNRPC
jgi:hypothetical protein